jgi:hypothetical protein
MDMLQIGRNMMSVIIRQHAVLTNLYQATMEQPQAGIMDLSTAQAEAKECIAQVKKMMDMAQAEMNQKAPIITTPD